MAFQQFLTALISFAGVLVGYTLAGMTQEELKNGKKYFLLGEKVMLIAIFVPGIWHSIISQRWVVLLIAVLGSLSVYVVRLRLRAIVTYFLTLVLFALLPHPYFVITATLLFLYGFPLGTLFFMEKNRMIKK
jgi:hypothetical protein